MNERIRHLRESMGLSRAAFGKKLGVSGDVINNLERGRVEIKEPMIKLICKEFNVNEAWLRTGEGGDDNMFTKLDPEDRFSINLGKLGATENKMAQNMINAIAEADPEKLEYIEEFMRACLGLDVKEKS